MFGKPTRILIALVLAALILYASQHRESFYHVPDLPPKAQHDPAPENIAGGVESTGESGSSPYPSQAELVPDAHMLQSADAFLEHFEAVRRLRGITAEEAKQSCNWAEDETVNFQFPIEADWATRGRPNEELELRRKELHTFVEGGMIPYGLVKDKFGGRGLVILAGNQDTVLASKVILRQLKRLDSSIAVEMHYWDEELSEEAMRDLSAMYQPLFFNDLSGGHNIVRSKKDGLWINYQLKTAALVNSRFAEPLLLDSDNIPLIKPEELYQSAVYQEYGTVFWPDVARSRPQNPAWAITNTPCRMDEYEQESGQLLVDKTRYWYHLQLASWMNNNQGVYYDDFLLGDKDTFRFAWHALKTKFGRPKKWLASVGTVNDGYYCGHSFAQHHPDDARVAFLHGGLVKTVSAEVMRWNRETKGGFYRNYKQAPTDEDPGRSVNIGIKFDGATYMPNHSVDFQWSQCIDMFDIEPGDLEEIIPDWETTFEKLGGYWQLDRLKEAKPADEAGASSVEAAVDAEDLEKGNP